MSNAEIRGRFVWHELMTSDTDAASDFYSHVVPWKTEDSGMPSYSLWMSGKYRAGGLMALPEESSATPPHWIIYIGTPDVDATVAAAEKLGGKVLKPAADIPNVGRFAVLSDPQGAAFAVFTPTPGPEDMPPGGGVGDFTWHELGTTDPDAAFDFYAELFGWTKGAANDMGEMVYQMITHGKQDVGGMYKARDNSTPPSWLSYVRVADAAKAVAAAKSAGGRLLNGPMEVPGGSWIAQILDPQGGAFAVVEPPGAASSSEDALPKKKAVKKAVKKPLVQPPVSAKSSPAPKATPPAKSSPPAKASPPPKAAPAVAAGKRAVGKAGKAVKTAAKKAVKVVRKAAKKVFKKVTKKTASRPAAKRTAVKKVAKKSPAKTAKKKGKGKGKAARKK